MRTQVDGTWHHEGLRVEYTGKEIVELLEERLQQAEETLDKAERRADADPESFRAKDNIKDAKIEIEALHQAITRVELESCYWLKISELKSLVGSGWGLFDD